MSSVLKHLQRSPPVITLSHKVKQQSNTFKIPFQTHSNTLVATCLCPPKEVLRGTEQQSTHKEQGSLRQSLSNLIRSSVKNPKPLLSQGTSYTSSLSPRANKAIWHSTSQALLSELQLPCPVSENLLCFLSLHCSYATIRNDSTSEVVCGLKIPAYF